MKIIGYIKLGSQPTPKPISTKMKPMIIQRIIAIITATRLMANALSQPQSKKCFTSASQMISRTRYEINGAISCRKADWAVMEVIVPSSKFSKAKFMKKNTTVPVMTIQSASVNLAFCLPAMNRPESQSAGTTMITQNTIWINSVISKEVQSNVAMSNAIFLSPKI